MAAQPIDDDKEKKASEQGGQRFKSGAEDLEQLEGIEKQQGRSRKAKQEHEQAEKEGKALPEETHRLIDDIEKSKRRLKNRFKQIKDYGDAIDEFGS